jgi:hypothetical protein
MPPAIVSKRVRELHAALVEAGWQNKKLPKEELERYLARQMGLSLPNIRVHIDMGRVLGLWSLIDQRPKPGALLVLPQDVSEVRDGMDSVHA